MPTVDRATDDQRALVRDLLKLLGIPLIAMVILLTWWRPWIPKTFSTASDNDVFSVATGAWDWEDADSICIANPHAISFSPDHSVMYLAFRVPWKDSAGTEHRVSEYDIQTRTSSQIRGKIRGETRRTEDGVPVVWDLVLTSPNSYAWHRTDWSPLGRTKEVTRCPVGIDSLIAPP
jgi:hypothetical protein